MMLSILSFMLPLIASALLSAGASHNRPREQLGHLMGFSFWCLTLSLIAYFIKHSPP
jgi:hypothetical protein